MISLLSYCLCLSLYVSSSQTAFSVHDDVFAYPQYEIDFSSTYILEDDAAARLRTPGAQDIEHLSTEDTTSNDDHVDFERMTLHGRRYLCSIPHVKSAVNNSDEMPSKEDEQKELIRAADRGWQLLQDMEGKQCLYYSTGWWSYAFCYNSYVKQFHSLPPAAGGARSWPPQEDQTTPSYILGKYEPNTIDKASSIRADNKEVTDLQTRADGNYLVQRLEGGTPCDLTGKNRRIEVEFHCHPQTTDRIGWIKETTTCAYLMVIYTPRLCNDVAFQPRRESKAERISCQEILSISEAAQLQENEQDPAVFEQSEEKPILIGNIELGAMKYVGKDGKKLERGRIVMTKEEQAEIIIMQKDGQIQGLSRTKMKELNIKPEDIEDFKKELQKIAGSNDWKIERLQDETGQVKLLGIVATDGDGGHDLYETAKNEEDTEGSKEEPKKEL